MSFIKSKHSGWTWELKRTPYGGGGGDIVQGIGDTLANLDKSVLQPAEQYAVPAALTAAALATGQPELLALDTSTVASADAIAAGLDYGSAAEAIDAGAATATELGLPEGTTLSDLGAVGGTASSAYINPIAFENFVGPTGIPDVAAANALAASQGATGLQGLLGYAKTGAQIIGGLGQLSGGIGALSAGNKMGQLAKQADPYAAYRSQAAAQLQNLLANPSTITTTPGYQFNLQQGLQAQQAQQAAQGRLVSGGGLLQAQQFGQQYATSSLQQQQALLAQLAGATQSPATGAAASAGLYGGQVGGQLGGAQAIAQGLGVLSGQSPLDTLYMNYNKSSPSVQGA